MSESRCGTCTMCCNVTAVYELAKPAGRWCRHCDVGAGCKIWARRPPSCRDFECAYYADEAWGEELRPDRLGVVFEDIEGRATVGALLGDLHAMALREPSVQRVVEKYLSDGRPIMAVIRGHHPLVILPRDGRWTVRMVYDDVRGHILEEARAAADSEEQAQDMAAEWLRISAGATDGRADLR